MKRRTFIKQSTKTAAGIATVPTILSATKVNTNADNIKLGIIGTGDRGGGLINVINSIEGLEVRACCDVLPFRLEEAIQKTQNQAKGYEEYRDLLADASIDAVLIATPFYLHDEVAIDAIKADKHVYCEKTLAKGYTALEQLLETSKGFKKVFQTGHQYHSSRLYTHAVELLKNGKVGNIAMIDCQWNRNGNWRRTVPDPKFERAINWRMYKEYSGGLVAELCSHQLDFCNWVTDALPISVIGTGGIDYWKDGRETYDNVHLIYTYPKGIQAKFTCLTSNAMDNYKIKVHGDKGTLILDYDKAWFYPEGSYTKELGEVDGVSGATTAWENGLGIPLDITHADPSKQALMDFRDAIQNNASPTSDINSGAKAAIGVQMGLDAMYGGEKVILEDIAWAKNLKSLTLT